LDRSSDHLKPALDRPVERYQLRAGSFFPALLEPRRRIDRALLAVVMEAYLHGVSTRKVDDLVKALGVDSGISKSEVSRICAELDGEVAAFRSRSLAHTASFPLAADPSQSLLTYTAEPGSPSQDALRLLASWAATTDDLEQPAPTHDSEQAESVERPD
jgi:Transposase, Mutator family